MGSVFLGGKSFMISKPSTYVWKGCIASRLYTMEISYVHSLINSTMLENPLFKNQAWLFAHQSPKEQD